MSAHQRYQSPIHSQTPSRVRTLQTTCRRKRPRILQKNRRRKVTPPITQGRPRTRLSQTQGTRKDEGRPRIRGVQTQENRTAEASWRVDGQGKNYALGKVQGIRDRSSRRKARQGSKIGTNLKGTESCSWGTPSSRRSHGSFQENRAWKEGENEGRYSEGKLGRTRWAEAAGEAGEGVMLDRDRDWDDSGQQEREKKEGIGGVVGVG